MFIGPCRKTVFRFKENFFTEKYTFPHFIVLRLYLINKKTFTLIKFAFP